MVYRSNAGIAVNPMEAGSNAVLLFLEANTVNPVLPYFSL